MKNLRNVVIIVAIAAAVYFLPGGGHVASTFEAALWVAFAVGIAYLGLRMYREHRLTLHGLGDRHRALLYGAVALGVFIFAARKQDVGNGLRRAAVVRAPRLRGVRAAGGIPPLAQLLTLPRRAARLCAGVLLR